MVNDFDFGLIQFKVLSSPKAPFGVSAVDERVRANGMRTLLVVGAKI